MRSKFKRLVLYAPFECASAATMVALGANEIHMGATSYLTAVDTSLKHQLFARRQPQRNRLRSARTKSPASCVLWKEQRVKGNPYPEVYRYLHPLVIGALDRSSSLSIRICQELLSYHMPTGRRAARVSRQLNSAYPSHSYPITAREARKLGLSVRDLGTRESSLLRELNALYSQMANPVLTDYDQEKSPQLRDLQYSRNSRGGRSTTRSTRTGTTARRNGAGSRRTTSRAGSGVALKNKRWVAETFYIR